MLVTTVSTEFELVYNLYHRIHKTIFLIEGGTCTPSTTGSTNYDTYGVLSSTQEGRVDEYTSTPSTALFGTGDWRVLVHEKRIVHTLELENGIHEPRVDGTEVLQPTVPSARTCQDLLCYRTGQCDSGQYYCFIESGAGP